MSFSKLIIDFNVKFFSSNFVAHGVRQKPEQKIAPEKFDFSGIPEDDKIWVDLMIRAGGRCGYDSSKMADDKKSVRKKKLLIQRNYDQWKPMYHKNCGKALGIESLENSQNRKVKT